MGRTAVLAEERQRLILGRIHEQGSVRVTELAGTFEVTEETIRRDLERLDRDRKLVRIHGGALPLERDRLDLPVALREQAHPEDDAAVAAYALRFVDEGDVIALDASAISRELAKLLPDMPLTVVTTALTIVKELVDRVSIRVICAGGRVDPSSMSMLGSLAEAALERFNIQKLFFSCQGVDLERGLSLNDYEQARLRRRMIELSGSSYLLAHHSRFGQRSIEYFASVREVSRIVTDSRIDPRLVENWQRAGVHLDVVP